MKVSISDVNKEFALYIDIVSLLEDIKLTIGGEALYYTLKKRKNILKFLKSYQTRKLDDFELQLDLLEKK